MKCWRSILHEPKNITFQINSLHSIYDNHCLVSIFWNHGYLMVFRISIQKWIGLTSCHYV
jgi:hypothetical protein